MKITELLSKESIQLNVAPKSKMEAIDTLIDLLDKSGKLQDKAGYKKGILAREESSSTGIGEGIAIPHAKVSAVKTAGLASITVPKGVDYDSLDGEPATIFFMIAAPEKGADLHIEVLQRLSTLLIDDDFRECLMNAKTVSEYLSIIDQAEANKFEEDAKKEEAQAKQSGKGYDILAVTACPTGIAHTFMAAESLEKKAKEKGVSIKVETAGSAGSKNILTKEEIASAKCIIVAADKKVETARFNGKKVIMTKVADGIHKADELIERAMKGEAPIFHSDEKISEAEENVSLTRQIYIHLMNGVSNMLPFVIGGGILIALAFLFDNYELNPTSFGSNTPFAAFLKQIGDGAFAFMLPVLAGFIAMSIGDRPALAVGFVGGHLANQGGSGFLGALVAGFLAGYVIVVLKKILDKLPPALEGIKPTLLYPVLGILSIGALIILVINPPVTIINNTLFSTLEAMGSTSRVFLGIVLGGMMSIDMGGPINKAAYVFGTASIVEGSYEIMAAVMIGGMVPPLSIALATTFFKNKFTEAERKSGIVNYVMGFAFITEGAIPFAAADPLRVIPACAIGSAVAGGLSMFFNCTLMAPHGGIFVVPVISNPLMYVVSLVIGSAVGMFLLGVLKKNIQVETSL